MNRLNFAGHECQNSTAPLPSCKLQFISATVNKWTTQCMGCKGDTSPAFCKF